jgi:zinc protease
MTLLTGISCAPAMGARAGGGAGSAPVEAARAGAAGSASVPPAHAGGGVGSAPVEVARAALGPLSAAKWRLANGLEVVLLPDPAATSVSYMTWFRVGSRNESEAAGETGLAHLFEHLMFTQTKDHPQGDFDRAVEAVGGNANASTYYDFTAYVDNVPPGDLALVAGLEADRMVNLALRKSQVDNERDVVVEERLSAVEDSVDGILEETLYKQSFKTHPYRWPVIGWMKDIKAVTGKKALAFYQRYYTPDNAVVIIAGQLDPAAALAAVVASYGGLAPSRDRPPDDARPEIAPAEVVRAALVRPVPADRLVIGYPAVGLGHRDRAAYEIVNELLLGGPSSRLYRRLVVDEELASSARGDIAPTRDPGLYAIWIQMSKGHAADRAEAIILEELGRLARTPVPARELDKAKVRLETGFWRQLDSSHGKAELLGQFEIACGDFRRLFERAGEYGAVTPEDVQRIATQYLSGARSVVVAHPRDEEVAARPPQEKSEAGAKTGAKISAKTGTKTGTKKAAKPDAKPAARASSKGAARPAAKKKS